MHFGILSSIENRRERRSFLEISSPLIMRERPDPGFIADHGSWLVLVDKTRRRIEASRLFPNELIKD